MRTGISMSSIAGITPPQPPTASILGGIGLGIGGALVLGAVGGSAGFGWALRHASSDMPGFEAMVGALLGGGIGAVGGGVAGGVLGTKYL